jgi:hypothetical protein
VIVFCPSCNAQHTFTDPKKPIAVVCHECGQVFTLNATKPVPLFGDSAEMALRPKPPRLPRKKKGK